MDHRRRMSPFPSPPSLVLPSPAREWWRSLPPHDAAIANPENPRRFRPLPKWSRCRSPSRAGPWRAFSAAGYATDGGLTDAGADITAGPRRSPRGPVGNSSDRRSRALRLRRLHYRLDFGDWPDPAGDPIGPPCTPFGCGPACWWLPRPTRAPRSRSSRSLRRTEPIC